MWHVALKMISASGFAFESMDDAPTLREGDQFRAVTIRVGDCVLKGDVVVRNFRQADAGLEIGCLFHPQSPEWEDRWMTLLAGIEAGRSG